MGHYESFFITSAGASAALLGLLVVAGPGFTAAGQAWAGVAAGAL